MTSLKVFQLKGIDKEKFNEVFENHNQVIGHIETLDMDLKSSIDNFDNLNEELVSLTFQHDFKHEMEMRGKIIEYPYFHRADFWVIFLGDKSYIFASGNDDSVGFILEEMKRLVADKKTREILIEPLKISNDDFTQILINDALVITNSWFSDLGEEVKAAFLSGHLKDDDGENELYKLLKEKAGKVSSANFISRRLGYKIIMSRNKGSISSGDQKATPESLIGHFKDVIHVSLNST